MSLTQWLFYIDKNPVTLLSEYMTGNTTISNNVKVRHYSSEIYYGLVSISSPRNRYMAGYYTVTMMTDYGREIEFYDDGGKFEVIAG